MFVAKAVKILTKYLDFSNGFLKEKTSILPEVTKLNQHAIKLPKNHQLFYRPIDSLNLIELKTLKAYIQNNFANDFIWPLKLSTGAFIFFIKKWDSSFCLYINY